ncbi:MAG: hypothetical protein COZ06_16875 [Armatimonadetes bacterium CG_4_10_14_3_um_filter_66_18]|nr:zinc ribbon domain-containing protein [Armatimonadota bacterium]OIP04202.1 MAG: hypothetical protein AUJ96_13270 [Armatimonadetes bacterium CG2_30_66_41]PIU91883.1 MAG: hypothetical protein COS65_20670 [Armatimonadetes bacterium CG06_land_8_20_14_3_00_66_21]PIX37306.1 MAG: hypothetical protein COZ57_35135 [Armatimonadetes bacterium CG_4_8_14_3_um_filter_66_20]PIY48232.1 MAG: hypothetical protein COZ06_16875 [Armatimonadetes bacterium CG_4_10_14_3_um_filter_66_18]PIZ47732.1 MAG: hypothetical
MPLYEYRCTQCSKRFTYLVGMIADNPKPACPQCKSKDLQKLISRVSRLRSEDDMLESLADPTKMGDLDDPKQVRQWARKMGRELGSEMGEDFSGEFEEMIEAEARGELDEEGGMDGGGMGGGGADDGTIY